jgi:hypothetical protein
MSNGEPQENISSAQAIAIEILQLPYQKVNAGHKY